MTDSEIERIAEIIARKVAEHPPVCPMFEPETVCELNRFAKCLKNCRRTAWSTLIGAVVIVIVTAIAAGIGVKLLELLRNLPKPL
jgi:hypothetical protein